LLTLRDDPAPVVDQHPAPVSGGPPGLYDDLRERHAPERLDRMNVDRVQTRVPHGAILPYGGGRLPGQRLSIRGTAGRCTDPGTEPGRGAEPPPGASPRSPRRRAAPDAAAAAGGRGSRAARWPAAGCRPRAPAAAGRAAVPAGSRSRAGTEPPGG